MRYLITGGSGFLGINLVRFLLERQHTVVSLDLQPFDYPDCQARVESILGDIRDRAAVERAMRGVQVVVHCAAALPLYTKADIISTDVDGTRNVLQAALDAKVERVIHISSTAVYGVPDHHPLFETDPAGRRRPVRRSQDRGRTALPRVPRRRGCASLSFDRSRSSAPSGSACSRCSTTGPGTAGIFPFLGRATTCIS